jgi:hypothetical protein
VIHVGRNHHAAAGDFGSDQFGFELLASCDEFHFGRDLPTTGGFDLGHLSRFLGSAVWFVEMRRATNSAWMLDASPIV